jgi:hypothetical protein
MSGAASWPRHPPRPTRHRERLRFLCWGGSLHLVIELVEIDDVLWLALTCRELRDALWLRFPRRRQLLSEIDYYQLNSGSPLCWLPRLCPVAASNVSRLQWWRGQPSKKWPSTVRAALKPASIRAYKQCMYGVNGVCQSNEQRDKTCMALHCVAARHGHIAVLQWLLADRLETLIQADRTAHEEIERNILKEESARTVKVLKKHGVCLFNSKTCAAAAEGGHLDVLRWLVAEGCRMTESTCTAAARTGKLHVLQWARANRCKWSAATCNAAAAAGHLTLLQWAHEHGCKWDESACAAAAGGGHKEVLQWARSNGCQWDEQTCIAAAKGGHLHVLQWAREQGCGWSADTCNAAAKAGRMEVLQWARANGCEPIFSPVQLEATDNAHCGGCGNVPHGYCRHPGVGVPHLFAAKPMSELHARAYSEQQELLVQRKRLYVSYQDRRYDVDGKRKP